MVRRFRFQGRNHLPEKRLHPLVHVSLPLFIFWGVCKRFFIIQVSQPRHCSLLKRWRWPSSKKSRLNEDHFTQLDPFPQSLWIILPLDSHLLARGSWPYGGRVMPSLEMSHRLLVCALFALTPLAAAQSTPFLSDADIRMLANEISGDRAFEHIRSLSRWHRDSGMEGYFKAADYEGTGKFGTVNCKMLLGDTMDLVQQLMYNIQHLQDTV